MAPNTTFWTTYLESHNGECFIFQCVSVDFSHGFGVIAHEGDMLSRCPVANVLQAFTSQLK